MSKNGFNIIIISIAITFFGFLMDGDLKEASIAMRFVELFAMFGLVCIVTLTVSKLFRFTKNKINLLRS